MQGITCILWQTLPGNLLSSEEENQESNKLDVPLKVKMNCVMSHVVERLHRKVTLSTPKNNRLLETLRDKNYSTIFKVSD
jgi:hypothetical protein